MNYIKTNNGLYSLSDNLTQTPKDVQIALINKNYKLGETIEELCDILIATYNRSIVLPTIMKISILKDDKEFLIKKVKNKDINIYAAIWTDKGLIYVAKMNDKGELELI